MNIDKLVIQAAIKRVLADRPLLFLMAALVMMGLIYVLVVAATIRPSEVTVYIRYTAFGEAHFYKAHWQYLINFVAFGGLVTIIHLALMTKFNSYDRRQTAVMIGWAGIAILVIGLVYALAVLQLGRSV